MSERPQQVLAPGAGEVVPQAGEAIDLDAVTRGRPGITRLQIFGGPQPAESVELFKRHAVGINADVATGAFRILTVTLCDLAHAQSVGRSLGQRRHAGWDLG